jgi:hypothetical protein
MLFIEYGGKRCDRAMSQPGLLSPSVYAMNAPPTDCTGLQETAGAFVQMIEKKTR